jgi:hypothetical protein
MNCYVTSNGSGITPGDPLGGNLGLKPCISGITAVLELI